MWQLYAFTPYFTKNRACVRIIRNAGGNECEVGNLIKACYKHFICGQLLTLKYFRLYL